jgi:hypothetical protein
LTKKDFNVAKHDFSCFFRVGLCIFWGNPFSDPQLFFYPVKNIFKSFFSGYIEKAALDL